MLQARQPRPPSPKLKKVTPLFRTLLPLLLLFPVPGIAQSCKRSQGELALTFAQVRAKLAVAAGQCMGFARDVEAQQFSKFLTRNKEWALKVDEWSGAELLKIHQTKGAPKSVGAQYYHTLIFQEQETARLSTATKYCGEALEHYRHWVELDPKTFREKLQQTACANPKLEVATTPAGN